MKSIAAMRCCQAIEEDIIEPGVREYGENIRVVSDPGEFTEMIVELPLVPPAVTTEEVAS